MEMPAWKDQPSKIEPLDLQNAERRTVLKGLTLGTFGLASVFSLGNLLDIFTFPKGHKVVLAKAIIMADKTLCSGCRICEMVCANFNSQGRNSSSLARITLEKNYLQGDYQPKVCFQCADPPCLHACPVAALQIDARRGTNARFINERACVGCQKCVQACQAHFHPPRVKFDSQRYRTVKCHLCFGDPQCVKFCPLGALRWQHSASGFLVGYPLVREVKI